MGDGGVEPACSGAAEGGARASRQSGGTLAAPTTAELLAGVATSPCECAEGTARADDAPCASAKVLAVVSQFAASEQGRAPQGPRESPVSSGSPASPLLPSAPTEAAAAVRNAAAALGCASESCVLTHPRFRSFAAQHGLPPRELGLELELQFKAAGPRDNLGLLSDSNLDSTLRRWARIFPEFYPCPFAMMDFDRHGDLFAELDMLDVLDGKATANLGPGVGRVRRPATCFGCIVNTDVSSGRGKHWVAVFVDCRGGRGAPWTVEYFNSAGNPPPREMTNWMERTRARLAARHPTETVAVTDVDHQESQTECGLYALYYIRRRLEGTPYQFFSSRLIPDAAMTEFRRHVFRAA